MKSTKLLIIIALIITLLTPNVAIARSYISDELPVSDYQIGNGINIEEEREIDQAVLPNLIPEELKKDCIWMQYPLSAYHFRSAPTEGAGWIQGKIADVVSTINNTIANMIFLVPKTLTYLFNTVLILCFDDLILTDSLDFINQGVKILAGPIFGNGNAGVASIFFILCLIILAIGIGITLLRAQIVRALTSVFLSGLCVALLVIYITNVNVILPPVFNFVNNVTGVAITSVAFMQDISASEGGETSIEGDDLTAIQTALVKMTNQAWFYLISGPWAVGQFGTADFTRLKMTDEEIKQSNRALKNTKGNKRKAYQRHDSLRSEYIDTNFLASSEDFKDDFLNIITDPYIDHGQHQVTIAAAGGGSSEKHIFIAFISLFPPLFYGALLALVGLPVLASQFVILGMLILLPLVLLLGVAGDSGRAVLVKYTEGLIGFLAIKFIYGFYLSFVMFFGFALAKSASPNIGLASFFICFIFGAAILLRKRFFDGCMSLLSFAPGAAAGVAKANSFVDKALKGGMALRLAKDAIRGRQVNKTRGSEPPQTNRTQRDEEKNENGETRNQEFLQKEDESYYQENYQDAPRGWNSKKEQEYEKYHTKVLGHGEKAEGDGYQSNLRSDNPLDDHISDNTQTIEPSEEVKRSNPVNIEPPWKNDIPQTFEHIDQEKVNDKLLPQQEQSNKVDISSKNINNTGKSLVKNVRKPDMQKKYIQKSNIFEKGQNIVNNLERTDNRNLTVSQPNVPVVVTGRPRLDDVNRYDELYHRPVYGGREPYQGPYGRPRQARKEDTRERKMPPGAKWND